MSDLTTIRSAIMAKLQSIPEIGRVHDHERFARGEKEFREMYESGGRILGWHLRRVSTRQVSLCMDDPGITSETHTWEIRGFMALSDAADASASEIVLDELIEAIRETFREDDTLGGVVTTCVTEAGAGVQLEDSGPVMFAGVLCHSARMALRTMQYQA